MPTKKEKALAWALTVKTQIGVVGDQVLNKMQGGAGGLSREFYQLLKAIGEAKSKQEEELIIRREAALLKKHFASGAKKEKIKEYVLRLLYCEMLGYEVEFGYVHALTLTQSSNLLEKKVGYLAVASFLHKDHPLMIMVVNSFRRDLESDNYLIVCAALITMGKLLTVETIPTVVSIVIKLLNHKKDHVRKYAVVVLHSCWKMQGTSLDSVMDKVRRALCDQSPSVMIASLNMFDEMIDYHGRERYMDLVSSFVSILKQIIDNRLPMGYNYHQIPAPWVQIQILQILRKLSYKDKSTSVHIYEVLKQTMKNGSCGINIGFSIIYECIRTATAIYPNPEVLQQAANAITKFITHENRNYKCIGIAALADIVTINPSYASGHQMAVMDCLEDQDETLQRKTLELLFIMTNSRNIVTITDRMIKALRSTKENSVKKQLVIRIAQNAERHAPNFPWYIETMKTLLTVGGDFVSQDIVNNLYEVLLQGTGEASVKDNQLRVFAMKTFHSAMQETGCPVLLIQVACWTIGEFGYLSSSVSLPDLIVEVCSLLESSTLQDKTRDVAITALWKLLARYPDLIPDVIEVLQEQKDCKSYLTQQTVYESLKLFENTDLVKLSLIEPSERDNFMVDKSLSFANNYVKEALECGALPYQTPAERASTEFELVTDSINNDGLKWEEYPEPISEIEHYLPKSSNNTSTTFTPQSNDLPTSLASIAGAAKQNLWSASGYTGAFSGKNVQNRPVYTQFPVASKYSQTIPTKSTQYEKEAKVQSQIENKKTKKKQAKREKEAAALFGMATPSPQSIIHSPKNSPKPTTRETKPTESLFGDLQTPAMKTVEQQKTPPTSSNNVIDLLGSIPEEDNHKPISNPPAAALSTFIQGFIKNQKVSHPPKFLVGDSTISLSYFIIWTNPDPVVAILFQTSQPCAPMDISGTFQFPDCVNVSLKHDSNITLADKQFKIQGLQHDISSTILCKCSLDELNMNMKIIVKTKHPKLLLDELQGQVNLKAIDFIRPLPIQVQEFSKHWKTSKFSQKASNSNIKDFDKLLVDNMNLHIVQKIGTEIIAAGSLKDDIVLVHARIGKIGVAIQVKGTKQILSNLFATEVSQFSK